MKKVAATKGHKVMRRDFQRTAEAGSTELLGLVVERLVADNSDS
jgi:hypothetical protein